MDEASQTIRMGWLQVTGSEAWSWGVHSFHIPWRGRSAPYPLITSRASASPSQEKGESTLISPHASSCGPNVLISPHPSPVVHVVHCTRALAEGQVGAEIQLWHGPVGCTQHMKAVLVSSCSV